MLLSYLLYRFILTIANIHNTNSDIRGHFSPKLKKRKRIRLTTKTYGKAEEKSRNLLFVRKTWAAREAGASPIALAAVLPAKTVAVLDMFVIFFVWV